MDGPTQTEGTQPTGAGGALALAIVGILVPIASPFAVLLALRSAPSGSRTAAIVLGAIGSVWLVVVVVSLLVNGVDLHAGS